MFRLALVLLALSCSLVQSAIVRKFDIDFQDEAELRSQFKDFKVKYEKEYDGQEEEKRFQIFVENLKQAKRIQEQDRGTAVYGVTKFSDLSDEEFANFYLNPIMKNNNGTWPQEVHWSEESGRLANLSIPSKFNWKKQGAVTRVKDQWASSRFPHVARHLPIFSPPAERIENPLDRLCVLLTAYPPVYLRIISRIGSIHSGPFIQINDRDYIIFRQGYYRLYRGEEACGINKFPTTALV
ncbi:uncharacterized protein [Scyliorhinus torazame]